MGTSKSKGRPKEICIFQSSLFLLNKAKVLDEPTEEDVLELGNILTELSPEGSNLDGVILTSQSRYTK